MSFSRAKAAVTGSRFADLRWVPETGSTNADVLAMLADAVAERPSEPCDLALVADHQTAGRGRLDRQWEAPAGVSLLMTAGTTRPVEDERRGLVLTAMALAGLEAVESVVNYSAKLKWPNDIMAVGTGADGSDLKLGGVLAEATPLSDGQIGLAVGIGLNCNWGSIPEGLAGVAASLDVLAQREVDREEVAICVLSGLARRLALLDSEEGAAAVVAEARHHSATLGREIVVHLPAGEIHGKALNIAADGALMVGVGDTGEVRRVVVGDVVHLRPHQ